MQRCTRANFAQNLFPMNLLMYAIVLIATFHKPYIMFSLNVSCIRIIYLQRLIILIGWLSVINRVYKDPSSTKSRLFLFTCVIITNGER